MLIDTETVNVWYVMSKGFKAYTCCPQCQSENVAHHKAREAGYSGIVAKCNDCQKVMPTRMKATLHQARILKAVI